MNDDITTKHQQDSYKYSVEQFDKSILFIASGALGGSFAFIKDVIPDLSKAFGKWLLISSWYIFGIVIFISLVNHFISALACSRSIKHAELPYKKFNRTSQIIRNFCQFKKELTNIHKMEKRDLKEH